MFISRHFTIRANAFHEVQSMKFVCEFPLFAAVFCLAGVFPLFAQTSPLLPSQKAPLSERVVAYQIDANYHPKNHSLDAQETLTWTNYTGQPQDACVPSVSECVPAEVHFYPRRLRRRRS